MNIIDAMYILGVKVPFTAKEAKRKYRYLAVKLHPDKGGSHDDMIELNNAYEICSKGIAMPVGPKITDSGVEFNFIFSKKKKNNFAIVVKWFSGKMLEKLNIKSYKGTSWTEEKAIDLYKAMIKECGELFDEIKIKDKNAIIMECADVANFAMMIADNARRKL